jgi:purine nucleosidase
VRTLLIDTDTAADDAVAILMALRAPDVEVAALTTVAGNVPLDQATHNALVTLEVAGRPDVPVHAGAAAPLVEEIGFATDVHGNDGMGDIDRAATSDSHGDDALDATLALLRASGPEITWVALGPLTNIAHAVAADPDVCRSVRELVVMGGVGDGVGNVTPAAEYNFWVDPHAAETVLQAGITTRLVGWDISRRDALVSERDLDALRNSGDPAAEFAVRITRGLYEFSSKKHHPGFMDLPDPVAMAAALAPEHADWARRWVAVETEGSLTRGALVVDHLGTSGNEPNVDLCTAYEPAAFRQLLHELLTSGSRHASGRPTSSTVPEAR